MIMVEPAGRTVERKLLTGSNYNQTTIINVSFFDRLEKNGSP
jgi:hypothetical protein